MTILAFLQNQWLKNAAQHERHLDALRQRDFALYVKSRRRMIAYALFAGCRSGQILKSYLGKDYCERIVWEEASLQIGSESGSIFPANPEHMLATIRQVEPEVIVGFGKIACNALLKIELKLNTLGAATFLYAPHPAARHPRDHKKLKELRGILNAIEVAKNLDTIER